MPKIIQNTLYLTTAATFVSRDHLTLQVKVPLGPDGAPATAEDLKSQTADFKSVSIPIHHLESLCAFGPVTVTPPALDLCWEHGVAVHFLSENGYLQARMTGVADTSVTLRRAQFRAADDPARCAAIARAIIAGKLQNSRNSLLRGARESEISDFRFGSAPGFVLGTTPYRTWHSEHRIKRMGDSTIRSRSSRAKRH